MLRLFPSRSRGLFAASLLAWSAFLSPASAQVAGDDAQNQRVNDALKRASSYLVSVQNPTTGAITNNLRPSNGTAMTSLAILALGALGHQPGDSSPEGVAMKKGLDFVLKPENQEADGYFGKADGSRMYGHGITTLMLAEMLGMGADEKQDALIREKCRKGVELILRSQRVPKDEHNRGGWRYQPDSGDSDMSITCWQTMALRAARNAGLDVPKEAIDLAVRYIKNLYEGATDAAPGNAGFGYTGRSREVSTTAEGLLALQVCGDYDSAEVKGAGDHLLRTGVKGGDRWIFYTSYYYAQGMYQRGDKYTLAGRKTMIDLIVPLQAHDGSWESPSGEERSAGKVYSTALGILALAVKNHYLPIYQR